MANQLEWGYCEGCFKERQELFQSYEDEEGNVRGICVNCQSTALKFPGAGLAEALAALLSWHPTPDEPTDEDIDPKLRYRFPQ